MVRIVWSALVVLALGACAAPRPPARPPPLAARASTPPVEVHFALVESRGAPAIDVVWKDGALVDERGAVHAWPAQADEDRGVFAYAARRAELHSGWEGGGASRVGWLEAGARIGVMRIEQGRVEAALFAWQHPRLEGPARAWVEARDLAFAPPSSLPAPAPIRGAVRTIAAAIEMTTFDDAPLATTFCGEIEVLEERGGGAHVVQREDGVAIEGLAYAPRAPEQHCPGLRVLESREGDGERLLVRHARTRPLAGTALPDGLVPVGPFTRALSAVVKRRGTVWWLVDDAEHRATCEAWRAQPTAEGAALVSRTRLPDGDTLIARFGLNMDDSLDANVVLLGPSSEVIAPPGRSPQSGGVSFACGETYAVVASDASSFTLLRGSAPLFARVIAYDPRDAERWYTDRARCEADAAVARAPKTVLAFALHQGC